MKRSKLYILILMFSFFYGCFSSSQLTNIDYTYLYDDDQKLIKPSFKIFHHHQDSSILYFQINSSDILYGNLDHDTIAMANLKMKYKIRMNGKEAILDSATISLIDFGKNNNDIELQGKVALPLPFGNEYDIEIRFRDELKDFNVVYSVKADKRPNQNSQFFLLRQNNVELVSNTLANNELLEIRKSSLVKNDQFLILSTDQERRKASPPFAMAIVNEKIFNQENEDTIIFKNDVVQVKIQHQISKIVPVNEKEITSLFVYYYYDGFPELIKSHDLIEPLRYISTTNEYNVLMEADDKHKAIEDFWLAIARDEKSAKKIIAEYYRRIETANLYFSSIKKGWKTDRGIIYIVYGKPYQVIINNGKEIWLYGEDNNILSVKFQFVKQHSSWSENDYNLIRDAAYKNNWYRAVDAWRQGRVY